MLVARPAAGTNIILAATDFSATSLTALRTAGELARRRGGELSVLHCLDLIPAAELMSPVPPRPEYVSELRESTRAKLEQLVHDLHLPANVVVLDEHARTGVARHATSARADLVVVGTTGRTGLRRLLLGSTAEAITHQAPLPGAGRPRLMVQASG